MRKKRQNFFLGAFSGDPPGNSGNQGNAAARIAHEASLADILFSRNRLFEPCRPLTASSKSNAL
jgi:hypothetical protein